MVYSQRGPAVAGVHREAGHACAGHVAGAYLQNFHRPARRLGLRPGRIQGQAHTAHQQHQLCAPLALT